MFGRRTSDLPDTRRAASDAAPSPLLASAETGPGGRAFGRRKDDTTIRVMHMANQAAPSGDTARASAAPTLVTRAAAPPPSLPAQRSYIESIKDRIHPKLMTRMDITAASA